MTWNQLTQEQRDVYSTFEKDLRALSGEFQRWLSKGNGLSSRYNSQILAILALLDDNTIVPNTSGLAGSSGLDSDAEMAALFADIAAILTTYNTSGKQQLRAKAVGQTNV